MNQDASFDRTALSDLVAREATLLDDGRWNEWLALFGEDGLYWVPVLGRLSRAGAPTSSSAPLQDRLALQARVAQLSERAEQAQHPAGQHVLQDSRLEYMDAEAGSAALRTPFLYMEGWGAQRLMLAGSFRHLFQRTAQGPRIAIKRVDLLGGVHHLPAVQRII